MRYSTCGKGLFHSYHSRTNILSQCPPHQSASAHLQRTSDDTAALGDPCYFVKDSMSGKKPFGLKDPRPDLAFGIKKKLDLDPVELTSGTKNLIRATAEVVQDLGYLIF